MVKGIEKDGASIPVVGDNSRPGLACATSFSFGRGEFCWWVLPNYKGSTSTPLTEILYNPFELRKILIILHILLKVQVKWMLFSKVSTCNPVT